MTKPASQLTPLEEALIKFIDEVIATTRRQLIEDYNIPTKLVKVVFFTTDNSWSFESRAEKVGTITESVKNVIMF